QLGLISFLELKTFDMRVQLRDGQEKGHDDIVIILVDEASLQSMQNLAGRWPWPRTLYADLNYFLAEKGAKVVLYDILFTEPQTPRNKNGELGKSDNDLVTSSIEYPHIIHAAQLLQEGKNRDIDHLLDRPLPPSFIKNFSLNITGKKQIFDSGNNNYYLPIPELYENVSGVGIVEFLPDDDGVFRRTKLLRSYQGLFFPVLSMAAVIHTNAGRELNVEDNFLNWGESKIPLLSDGTYLVNPKKEYQVLSIGGIFSTIQQIQEGNLENLVVNPDILKDKIVLIGASAVGVEDLKQIAYGPNFPGVYLHASIISNILADDYIKRASLGIEVLITIVLVLIITLLVTRQMKIYYKTVIPLLIIFAYLYFVFQLFNIGGIWMSAVFPVLAMLAVYASSFVFMTFTESSERLKTRKMFSQFVSPDVLAKVMESGSSLTAEIGAKENLTVLFSDIRGFTSLSETIQPEKVVEFLNYYLHEMVELVFKYHGTLDKFIGDAVMAFWGAPIKEERHARQAVLCALDMIDELKRINTYFLSKALPEIKIGIGMNSGPMIVGNIGSVKRLDYTVIGDNVNLASRIEGLTKTYGCSIIISESTNKMLDNDFICRIVDQVRVKGKSEPIVLYQPLTGPGHDAKTKEKAKETVAIAAKAFAAYQNKDWDTAENSYKQLLVLDPDDLVSKNFIAKCRDYRTNPPSAEWDGAYSYTTK
ncbi:adenylate/guanylate cyclase domain-containing protein, partial [bacterium]|nr:adenylate/guanylate cyclase domain-containing protein [bacterium]